MVISALTLSYITFLSICSSQKALSSLKAGSEFCFLLPPTPRLVPPEPLAYCLIGNQLIN